MVTDEVGRFDESGIKLKSGKYLEADVVLMATGFNMTKNFPFPTGMKVQIDGNRYVAKDNYIYNSCFISGLPNVIYTFGYAKFRYFFLFIFILLYFFLYL